MSKEERMVGDKAERSALKDTPKKTTWSPVQKGIGCHAMEFILQLGSQQVF